MKLVAHEITNSRPCPLARQEAKFHRDARKLPVPVGRANRGGVFCAFPLSNHKTSAHARQAGMGRVQDKPNLAARNWRRVSTIRAAMFGQTKKARPFIRTVGLSFCIVQSEISNLKSQIHATTAFAPESSRCGTSHREACRCVHRCEHRSSLVVPAAGLLANGLDGSRRNRSERT